MGGTQGCPMSCSGVTPALGRDQHPVAVSWRGWRSLISMTGSVVPVPRAANRLCPPNSRCSQIHPHVRAREQILCRKGDFAARPTAVPLHQVPEFGFPRVCAFLPWILAGSRAASPQPSVSGSSSGPSPELWARRWPRQSRSSPFPPRRGERGEEIAADGAASAAGLGMTKFGSATCWLFFLLWRIRASRWSNSPREPEGIHPDLGDGHCRAGERVAGEQGGS